MYVQKFKEADIIEEIIFSRAAYFLLLVFKKIERFRFIIFPHSKT